MGKLTEKLAAAMQADRDAGMTIQMIMAKYGLGRSTVLAHTKRPENKRGLRMDLKENWPEWDEWRRLHEKYGKKKEAETQPENQSARQGHESEL